MKKYVLAACFALSLPVAALADPEGVYDISGTNADTGAEYTGTVEITRTGETYAVKWTLGEDEIYGTAVGAKISDNSINVNAADPSDVGLSLAYALPDGAGAGMFFEQPDGTWAGVWTNAGSKKVSPEKWVRAK